MKNFEWIRQEMIRHEMILPAERVAIRLQYAKEILTNAMKYFLGLEGRELVWLPEYNKVAEWLSDNKGSGLFMYGNCGRGKSLLTRVVLPAIFLKYFRKVVSVYDMPQMNERANTVMSKHIVALDDIGTEEVLNVYGNKRMVFAELIDAAEKHGKLLLISTNLDESQLYNRYGSRVLDRVKGCTTRVLFEGKSLRQ